MSRATILPALAAAAALAGCAPTLGPPPPPPGPHGPAASTFRAEDFAWSADTGRGGIAGRVVFHRGPVRYSCASATVILTPETPWTRRRMRVLYGSTEFAAEPADAVRARTPSAPSGDYSAFVRRTTCDGASRFTFSGLPNGAWYAITIVKPVSGGGPGIALMKRVVTEGGHVTPLAM